MKPGPEELRVVWWDQMPGEKGPEGGVGGGWSEGATLTIRNVKTEMGKVTL